ncbi:MAG TPA: tetratricopeptide repeat protein [Bryobacteraceae bacterium]|nr:tetratricopeptide repeat protein [Bryobacteraceae bacterium]
MNLFPLMFLLFWQDPSPEAVAHLKAGAEALNQSRSAAAVAEFREATKAAPGLPAGFVGLGQALMQSGDFQGAVPPLKRALELNNDLPGAHQLLGFALLAAGYANEAIPHLEKVQALDAVGVAQLKTGKYTEAIANLQAALAQRPGDVDLMYYLGRASGLLSQQTFEQLRATDPNSARAHQILGETYAVLHNTAGAEQEFHEALRLRPVTPGVHLELGELYSSESQWDKAEKEFRAEASLQPGDAEAAFRLGNALLQQGKVKEAKRELERASTLAPGAADVLYTLGKAASLDGDKASAEKAWLSALEILKDGPVAAQSHFGLAALYRERGDAAKADAEMKEFQRLQKAVR